MNKEKTCLYEMKSSVINILPFVVAVIIFIITFLIIKVFNINFKVTNIDFIVTMLLYIPYTIIHEILHSIGYVINGAQLKNITFGVHMEKGILCCSCKQTINKKTVLWSLMYPFIFIGIITYILGLIFNLPILIILSALNIIGCSGDIVMFLNFWKLKNFKFFEYDNPLAFGLITNEDLENKKLYGLKEIQNEKIIQTTNKKVTISKTSIIILLVYYIILLCCAIL